MNELEELRARARRDAEKKRSKQRELYTYAKSLGFSYTECKLLASTSRAKIDRLAALKAKEKE